MICCTSLAASQLLRPFLHRLTLLTIQHNTTNFELNYGHGMYCIVLLDELLRSLWMVIVIRDL